MNTGMISHHIHRLINDIKNDKTSGASELIKIVIEIFKDLLNSIKDPNKNLKETIIEISKELIGVRPSMATLINTIGYLMHDIDVYNIPALNDRIESFHDERVKREEALSLTFQSFLETYDRRKLSIMLISYSSTITKLLKKIKGIDFSFYILESRPLLEGRRTANLLSSDFEINLISDSAMGKFVNEVDLILIGIDSILKDGSIINKIGSYPLTCIGKANDKDVYAVGDSFKYNVKSHYGQEIIIESKPIYEIYSDKIKNELFNVHNYYFDITPPQYLNGIISDLGILSVPEFLDKIVTSLPIEWYKLFLNP